MIKIEMKWLKMIKGAHSTSRGGCKKKPLLKKKKKILKANSRTRWVGDGTNPMEVGVTVINNFFPSCNSHAPGSIPSAKYLVISNRDLKLNHIFKSEL